MDTASVESDIPDLLQSLRFPAVFKLDQGEFGDYGDKHIEVLHRRKIPNETRDLFKFPKTNIIPEDLSFLAITGLLPRAVYKLKTGFRTNDTPIIGASIVQNCKDRFKSRSHRVKVHATVNGEKVTNKEKLYLVVRGSRKNKVYELRSTENTLLPNDSKLALLKDFVQHNEMDKKKKKATEKKSTDKKNKDKKKKEKASDEPEDEYHSDIEICECPQEAAKTRSQIKISGRIGLGKDDRYVMDCEATVNDKTIEARCYNRAESVTNSSSDLFKKDDTRVYTAISPNKYYQSRSGQSFEDVTAKRNSFAQTGSSNNSPRIISSDSGKEDDVYVRKESQSTQANFNICVKNNNGSWSISPKCGCGKVGNDKDDYMQQINFNGRGNKVLEEPIIVISVYPKKAIIENKNATNNENINSAVHNSKSRQKSVSPMSTSTSVEKTVKKDAKRTSNNEKEVKGKKNQRGTSPKKNSAGGAENKKTNIENVKTERATTKTTQRERSISPKRSEKQVDEKIINKNSDNVTKRSTKTKSVQTEMKRESSPKKGNAKIIKTKSVHKETAIEKLSRRDASQQKNSSTLKQTSKSKNNETSTKSENNKVVTKSINNDKGRDNQQRERSVTQTALERPKSALRTILDNVLKHPKEGASEITINIDAENELYNVFLRHNPKITDLKLKKVCICPPEAPTVRCDKDGENNFNTESSSMTNFLLQPPESDSNRKRAKSQTTITTESNEKENSSRKLSFTKARDSLEISHMRDDLKQTKSRSFMQPQGPKHFNGDQCSLIDPMERDKEVRQLLGVNNANIDRTSESIDSKRGNGGDGDIGDFLSRENKIQIFRVINDNVVPINSYKCIKCEPTKDERKHRQRSPIESSSLYQQIMLVDETGLPNKGNGRINRNNVIHLTVANKRPINLTKSQYDKVKKAIQIKILKAASVKKCVFKKTSFVSVSLPSKRRHKKKTINKCTQTFGFIYSDDDYSDNFQFEREIQTTDYQRKYYNESSSASLSILRIDNTKVREDNELGNFLLEARYSSLSSIKRVKFDKRGKPDCEKKESSGAAELQYSVKTIFQYKAAPRKKKSLTPNLGPSVSSLYADKISLQNKPGSSSMKYILPSQQKKKPFLRRLMSCLVMRTKTSRSKIKFGQPLSSGNTDTSYHISTTLAPMEMTSSLFDTSISFYSNHAIVPINYKMKKSFFSSMRGLLKKN